MPKGDLEGQAGPDAPEAAAKPFTVEDESALRESLKRCSPATIEAAIAYRKTQEASHLPAVIIGVIERFVEPDLRPKLKEADDELRLVEDLGIDSLTMMEIVILVEDVLQMQINNEDLRNLRTVGDIKVFIDCKVRGLPPPKPTKFFPIEEIVSVMPIQAPFLFLNEATIAGSGAQGKYKITGQEFFLQGHFKDNPVMPASLMLEALGQLAVLYLLEGAVPDEGKIIDRTKIFFTSCEGVRCHRICRPGDLLSMSVKPKRTKMPLATFEGSIRVGQDKAAMAEEITLTFAYADAKKNAPAEAATTSSGSDRDDTHPPVAAAVNA
ncbi:phosphopantetheine-binding protein [Synoicihabitans lomoniglobus]|uniref:Phosphopantetheine-binding protein n=1 Tax=Synoicihabitans lomoniglobus TaxID=2909285 RepID=A0AAF0I5R3_9BACT|nr:phosphopantetheine-binding protein [Opitutaceae bacterium LMO-M01]WED67424.1 phosphopantetheine-binding protein [Opitutaceae bacterium LMO-M01]